MSRSNKRFLSVIVAFVILTVACLSGCSSQPASGGSGAVGQTTAQAIANPAPESVAEQTESKADEVAASESRASGITDGTVNLYLIRHGRTIMNTYELCQGWSDSPLTAAGRQVAKNVGAGLSDTVFDAAYTSDLQRAVETGEIILGANKVSGNLVMVPMTGLREMSYGGYEGLPNIGMREAIMEYYGVTDWNEVSELVGSINKFSVMSEVDPEGIAETHEEIVARITEAFDTIVKETEAKGGGNVAVFGHGVTLYLALGVLAGEDELPSSGLANASVSKMTYKDGVYSLDYVNNMEFAEKGEAIRAVEEPPVTIYLTRHGRTWFNTWGRTQGWVDSMLTEEGREVATQLGKGLSDVKFEAVYTSGLGRTIETAELVLAENNVSSNLELQKYIGLREANYGKYEGGLIANLNAGMFEYYGISSGDELATEDQTLLERFLYYTSETDESGEAENVYELKARVKSAMDELAEESSKNGGGNILVVAHGNAIMAIVETLGVEGVTSISNSSVTKIVYQDGEYTVESVNDMSYTEAGAGSQ